jgi:hypothetical protein
MLIGHRHEIEHYLTELFLKIDPVVIGNDYLVFGTVEKKVGIGSDHRKCLYS